MSLRLDTMDRSELESILRPVLLVARLGEADLRGWWGTHSFGPAGRVVLKQRLPRTWRMAAIELDIAAAANRHNKIIDRRNAIHLFSDNWPVRRWTNAWVSEQKTASPPDDVFERLEAVSEKQISSSLAEAKPAPVSVHGPAVRIGTIEKGALEDPTSIAQSVAELAGAYAEMNKAFLVPYLEVEG